MEITLFHCILECKSPQKVDFSYTFKTLGKKKNPCTWPFVCFLQLSSNVFLLLLESGSSAVPVLQWVVRSPCCSGLLGLRAPVEGGAPPPLPCDFEETGSVVWQRVPHTGMFLTIFRRC